MTIERLDMSQWGEIIGNEEKRSPFFSKDFLSCLSTYLNGDLELFGFYQGTKLIGFMPSFYVNYGPIKTFFSPPINSAIPFLGYSFTKDYYIFKQNKKEWIHKTIVNDLKNELQKKRVNYSNIQLDSQLIDIRPFIWNGFNIILNYDYIISLQRTEDEIWNSFKPEARRDISSGERQGISIERATNVHEFWIQEEARYNEQKLKIPIFKEDYIQNLIAKMPTSFHLYYAYNSSGNIVSSIIVFIIEDSVYLWLGATRTKDRTHANDLLFWDLMKQYKALGYSNLIILGANLERLCEFKSKFNPQLSIRFGVIQETILGNAISTVYRKILKKNKLSCF